jgi:hypothetical protein
LFALSWDIPYLTILWLSLLPDPGEQRPSRGVLCLD